MALLSLENLLAYAVQVAVISAAAACILWLLRVREAGLRHSIWRVLLCVAVLLPFLQPWNVTTTIIAGGQMFGDLSLFQVSPETATPTIWDTLRPHFLVLALVSGFAIRLCWIGLGVARLTWRLRGAPSHCDISEDVQRELGVRATVRYIDGTAQPATFGVISPVVLLPKRLRDLDPSITRAVLVHELLHVRRRDWAWMVGEELIRAALWFNPAVWWLVDRVQATREEVVDHAAVGFAGGRGTYVRALVEFAETTAAPAAPAFASRRHLFARIKGLCEESNMSITRAVVTLSLTAAAVCAIGAASVTAFPINVGEDVLVAPALQDPPPPPVPPVALPPPPPPTKAGRTVLAPAPKLVLVQPPPPPQKVVKAVPPSRKMLSVMTRQMPAKKPQRRMPPPPPPLVPVEVIPEGQAPPPPPPSPRRLDVRIVQTPELIRDVKPVYPAEAMSAKIQGSVEVEVVIENDGTVKSARVIRSIPALDDAALDAARQWRFKPFEGNAITRTIELTFALRDGPTRYPAVDPYGKGPVRVGGTIRAPVKVIDVRPDYPAEARAKGTRGSVIIEVRIGANGAIEDARVVRSIPGLDQAALNAVKQWKYEPTLLNGVAVPVITTVTVNFKD